MYYQRKVGRDTERQKGQVENKAVLWFKGLFLRFYVREVKLKLKNKLNDN